MLHSAESVTRFEKERWLKARGVPIPYPPLLPLSVEDLTDAQVRAADHAYLEAWDARDAEIDRIYAIARRDAEGPPVPTVQ